jgi:membrane protease YdiL (CAAX protease family)
MDAMEMTAGRQAPTGRWLALAWAALVLLISLCLPLGTGTPLRFGCLVLLLWVLLAGRWEILPATFLLFCLFVGPLFYPELVWRVPTLPFLLPLAATFGLCAFFPGLRRQLRWLRKGEVDSISLFLAVLTSLLAASALLLWAVWTDNLGAGAGMVQELKGVPAWFLVTLGVPLFACVNALAEEFVYRGFLLDALEKQFPGRTALPLALQATAFAAAHFVAGFPNGKLGYLMAFVYALMLGHLRQRTKGLLAPVLTHVTADLVIGFTLVVLAR